MLNNISQQFYNVGEIFAGAMFENEDRPIFDRMSHAYAEYWSRKVLPAYNGGKLYPCGPLGEPDYAVTPSASYVYTVDKTRLDKKDPALFGYLIDEFAGSTCGYTIHSVAGFGFTHSLPHYGRIAKEGFDSYYERIQRKNGELKNGLSELLDGIRKFRGRCIDKLIKENADEELIAALKKVPFRPAENIYEAIVCMNFIYYLDCCDNVGRLDTDLLPFWKGEDIVGLLEEFFKNVDETDGYSSSIGPDYNPLTLQCLKAIKGKRRPQIELRIRPDMPKELWDAATESLAEGCSNPSFYNDPLYEQSFKKRFPDLPHEDFLRFCGVGCTESTLAGLTNAGSLDAGIHTPEIFSVYMRENLGKCGSFEEFYNGFIAKYRSELEDVVDRLREYHTLRAKCRPHPMRTLVVDDCIDKDKDFNNGGARYSWSVINFAGLVNVFEDMIAVKELVFDKKLFSAERFVKGLDEEDPEIFTACKRCKHYGVDDDEADSLAAKILEDLLDELDKHRTCFGGQFLPASIQFNTCVWAGMNVLATPDGRKRGTSLADSLSAIHGNDTDGITAMLNSVAKLPLWRMTGTPVLNVRLEKTFMKNNLPAIVSGFFANGGMQMQITCLNREDMLDAQEHPENHGNLVVKVGGYSDYFVRLPKELQNQIISRTEFV